MIAAELMLLAFIAGAIAGGFVVWVVLRTTGADMYRIGRIDGQRAAYKRLFADVGINGPKEVETGGRH